MPVAELPENQQTLLTTLYECEYVPRSQLRDTPVGPLPCSYPCVSPVPEHVIRETLHDKGFHWDPWLLESTMRVLHKKGLVRAISGEWSKSDVEAMYVRLLHNLPWGKDIEQRLNGGRSRGFGVAEEEEYMLPSGRFLKVFISLALSCPVDPQCRRDSEDIAYLNGSRPSYDFRVGSESGLEDLGEFRGSGSRSCPYFTLTDDGIMMAEGLRNGNNGDAEPPKGKTNGSLDGPKQWQKTAIRYQRARKSSDWAQRENPNLRSLREQWDYIKRHGCPAYENENGEDIGVPAYESWTRYLRAGGSDLDSPRSSPRAGREYGASVVRSSQI